jgi:hypothetical protein
MAAMDYECVFGKGIMEAMVCGQQFFDELIPELPEDVRKQLVRKRLGRNLQDGRLNMPGFTVPLKFGAVLSVIVPADCPGMIEILVICDVTDHYHYENVTRFNPVQKAEILAEINRVLAM